MYTRRVEPQAEEQRKRPQRRLFLRSPDSRPGGEKQPPAAASRLPASRSSLLAILGRHAQRLGDAKEGSGCCLLLLLLGAIGRRSMANFRTSRLALLPRQDRKLLSPFPLPDDEGRRGKGKNVSENETARHRELSHARELSLARWLLFAFFSSRGCGGF